MKTLTPLINDGHRKAMQTDGYTILENVFAPEETAKVATVLEALEEKMRADLAAAGGQSGISRASEITFNDHLAERDERVRAFATRPEFVEISTAFLGPDTDLYWNQTVFKHPEGEKIFPWHQDDGYTPVDPSPYLTLWLALNDATHENGCVSVLPGSHLRGLVPHEPSPIGLVCHSADDPDQGVMAPVKAGSIVAFWSLTMHKSGVNRSSGIRKAFILQYATHGLRYQGSGELVPDLIPVARGGQPA